jgi:ATP-binding cassette, subfamily B (MDR/TAP), member 1
MKSIKGYLSSLGLVSVEEDRAILLLMVIATAYFAITWGWASCWGFIGARISRGLRIQMFDRALGLDQTYYETECPDVSRFSCVEVFTKCLQITSRLTVDAQTVQSGTAEKVGIFIQSVSYFVVAFIVGFILNARLTSILFAAVIPAMAMVVFIGTTVLNRYSKDSSKCTSSAASLAEGAIKAVQVVQAFDAFEPLTNDHKNHLAQAMEFGVLKAVSGAILLGSVFFIA